jgi:hypothetical protein
MVFDRQYGFLNPRAMSYETWTQHFGCPVCKIRTALDYCPECAEKWGQETRGYGIPFYPFWALPEQWTWSDLVRSREEIFGPNTLRRLSEPAAL